MIHFIDILAAKTRISRYTHRTPLLRSQRLDEALGCRLAVKCEMWQKTGSFKARGAINAILTQPQPPTCVTTYSSGNHGQALAWAARHRGIHCVVFVPENAPQAKVSAMQAQGAELVLAGTSVVERRDACSAYAVETGATLIPPFDDAAVIAGQGTMMIEVLEQLPQIDRVLVPTGGGGLLAGISTVAKALRADTTVLACEPESGNDGQLSIESGRRMTGPTPNTIADGVRHTQLGELTWPIIQRHVDGALTCSDQDIIAAMKLLLQYHKIVVEPSGALGVACLMAHQSQFANQTVVAILTGGNIAAEDYAQHIAGP